jgi:glutamyl-tRNA reductase
LIADLVVFHWKTKSSLSDAEFLQPLHSGDEANIAPFLFRTCLRDILVVSQTSLVQSVKSMVDINPWKSESAPVALIGLKAYEFLSEVICGLHSPIVGETEVFGQFKKTAEEYLAHHERGLSKLLQALTEDAKLIRDRDLRDLGSQSYGSFVRRELKGYKNIHIIGAGTLSHDIVTWLSKANSSLTVHSRNSEKSRKAKTWPGSVSFSDLNKISNSDELITVELTGDLKVGRNSNIDALLICAPLGSAQIAEWLKAFSVSRDMKIIDLRGEAGSDDLASQLRNISVMSLPEVFAEISKNQGRVQTQKAKAEAMLQTLALKRSNSVEIRPFGWEDVCA